MIAGWGEDTDVKALKAQLAQAPSSAEFIGPVYGEAKTDLLGSARFIALPSLSEGLPMVVLEAWASGVPALMSQHCHLPEGFAAAAAIDCGTSVDAVGGALRSALAIPEAQWLEMAGAASGLAATDFAPPTIAAQWGRRYARLMDSSR